MIALQDVALSLEQPRVATMLATLALVLAIWPVAAPIVPDKPQRRFFVDKTHFSSRAAATTASTG